MGTDLVVDPFQLDFVGNFDAQINNVLQAVRLTRQEVDDLRKLFIDLERSLQNAWEGCKVMPFGSIVTGLGIKSSDVDVYVFVPEEYEDDQVRFVLTARKVLRRRPLVYHQPFAITTAKVPIVKFLHIPTRRSCDVNFKSPSGVRNSRLIAHLLHRDKRALPFTIIIKYWSKVHKLTGTNLIPNYALTMLSIFYLQQKKVLPPVVRLQSPNHSFYVDNWDTAFNERYIYKSENNQNLYELLGGFFNFYSTFNFEEYIISPFLGCPVRRQLFKNVDDVPEEFNLYKRNVCNKECTHLKVDTKICVQDPFEHNRNCTTAVFPRLAQLFILHIQLGYKIYEETNSTDFLRDILTKKPIIPQEMRKNRKNKKIYNGVTKDSKNANDNGTKDPDESTEALPNQNVATPLNTVEDNLPVPVATATENNQPEAVVISNVPARYRPVKRTLHNSLAELYRKTKRRKM